MMRKNKNKNDGFVVIGEYLAFHHTKQYYDLIALKKRLLHKEALQPYYNYHNYHGLGIL